MQQKEKSHMKCLKYLSLFIQNHIICWKVAGKQAADVTSKTGTLCYLVRRVTFFQNFLIDLLVENQSGLVCLSSSPRV